MPTTSNLATTTVAHAIDVLSGYPQRYTLTDLVNQIDWLNSLRQTRSSLLTKDSEQQIKRALCAMTPIYITSDSSSNKDSKVADLLYNALLGLDLPTHEVSLLASEEANEYFNALIGRQLSWNITLSADAITAAHSEAPDNELDLTATTPTHLWIHDFGVSYHQVADDGLEIFLNADSRIAEKPYGLTLTNIVIRPNLPDIEQESEDYKLNVDSDFAADTLDIKENNTVEANVVIDPYTGKITAITLR